MGADHDWNNPSSGKDPWAKRPKITDRKRNTVPLDMGNASSWKLAVLSALKEINY